MPNSVLSSRDQTSGQRINRSNTCSRKKHCSMGQTPLILNTQAATVMGLDRCTVHKQIVETFWHNYYAPLDRTTIHHKRNTHKRRQWFCSKISSTHYRECLIANVGGPLNIPASPSTRQHCVRFVIEEQKATWSQVCMKR